MSKQAGLSVAIGLVGVGIILHALPKLGGGPAAAAAAPASTLPTMLTGNPAPSIVWYGSDLQSVELAGTIHHYGILFRAWSDGTVEMRRIKPGYDCVGETPCTSEWFVVSSPDEGTPALADINFDQTVDGADLANLLAAWGPAPRSPIPPSDCPLGLLNP